MLVDPQSETGAHDASQRRDEDARAEPVLGAARHAKAAIGIVLAGAVGAGAYWLLAGADRHYRAGEVVEKAEPVIRSGRRVTVPEGSPVRAKLAIEPVAAKAIKQDLVLPAVVEADPPISSRSRRHSRA